MPLRCWQQHKNWPDIYIAYDSAWAKLRENNVTARILLVPREQIILAQVLAVVNITKTLPANAGKPSLFWCVIHSFQRLGAFERPSVS